MEQSNDQAIEQFIERVGLIAQVDGLPRIAGRIMGLLVIYGGPFSFAEIAKRLQVSRGSISTNRRLLENLGVIERVARPGIVLERFSAGTIGAGSCRAKSSRHLR
jgi:DNA-binding transcriptional regulator GbsR (MarR family)